MTTFAANILTMMKKYTLKAVKEINYLQFGAIYA